MSDVAQRPPEDVAIALWSSLEPEVSFDDDPLIAASSRGRHADQADDRRLVRGIAAVELITARLAKTLSELAATMSTALNDASEPETKRVAWCAESVDVTFGIQLSAGLQALFVAQGQSSAQVAMRFVRSSKASA